MATDLRVDLHYCKHCGQHFQVRLPSRFSGDAFLVCPGCAWKHYRHFSLGEATHCDLNRRHADPIEVCGSYS